MAAPAPAAPKPRPPSAAEQVVASVLQESAAAKPAPPLELTRRYEAPRVSADVRQGYEALRSGDAKAARGHYEAALAADPASIDAHLGLAIGGREGRRPGHGRPALPDARSSSSRAIPPPWPGSPRCRISPGPRGWSSSFAP